MTTIRFSNRGFSMNKISNFPRWLRQNKAEIIDCAEGCLLDNTIYACKRGTAFVFEEYETTNSSRYRVHFVPYKDKAATNRLYAEFQKLQEEV